MDKGFHIVREIGVERLAAGLHACGSGLDRQSFSSEAAAGLHEHIQKVLSYAPKIGQ